MTWTIYGLQFWQVTVSKYTAKGGIQTGGSHDGDYEDQGLLGCAAMYFCTKTCCLQFMGRLCHPEDAGYRFFQNPGTYLPKYMLPHPIKP